MAKRKALSMEEILPLILSATGVLGIFPFVVIRFINGEWSIGTLNLAIVAAFAYLGIMVFRTGNVRTPSIFLSLLCAFGVVGSVYLKGPGQLYWAYPAIITMFYLLRPREGLILTVIMLATVIAPLLDFFGTFELTTSIITLVITTFFAFGFSVLTGFQHEQLMQLATIDPLTNAGNRRALDEKLDKVIAARQRDAQVASLLLIDLDHFKSVNDAYGHAAGDQILIRLTEIIELRIRTTDSLYRIGGEEFVVLAEGQSLERAEQLAEQLRTLVEVNELAPNQGVTISVGVAELHDSESREKWLSRADDALYEAKRAGRNTIFVAKFA